METGFDIVDEFVRSVKTGPSSKLHDKLRLLFDEAELLDVSIRFVHLPSRIAASTPNIVHGDAKNWMWRLESAGHINTPERSQALGLSDASCHPNKSLDACHLDDGVLELRSPISLTSDPALSTVVHQSCEFSTKSETLGWLVVRVRIDGIHDREKTAICNLHDACLQLACALSSDNAPLTKLANTLIRLLLFPTHADLTFHGVIDNETLHEGDIPSGDLEAADSEGVESGMEGEVPQIRSGRLAEGRVVGTTSLSLTTLLTFKEAGAEIRFKSWQAMQMFRYDVLMFCLCILSHSLVVFFPGTAYHLLWRIPAWKWLAGYVQIPLLAIVMKPRNKEFYCNFREILLLGLYLWVFFYNNYFLYNMNDYRSFSLGCNGQAYAYIWLPLFTAFCQARFVLLAPVVLGTMAMSLQGLYISCGKECGETTNLHLQCFWIATYKIVAMVTLALAVVYVAEWRARRVWRSLN